MIRVAKVFANGASQAVRLPKEFRFEGKEVCIKRVGSAVLLFPKEAAWEVMAGAMGGADDDYMGKRKQPRKAERRKRIG